MAQNHIPNVIRFNDTEIAEIDKEIERLCAIGAIGPSIHEQGEFISNIFTRFKTNGKIRIILNLKPLNKFLKYEHFKMEHLNFVKDLVRKDDWFGSIDLTDAYFSVQVRSVDWKYLKFYWKKQLFSYRVMVFGLSSAPRVFTRLCKPILAHLRGELHMRCSLYIDDLLIIAKSKVTVEQNLNTASELLQDLGFCINWAKSSLIPSQMILHLGFNISSVHMSISIPPEKVKAFRTKCLTVVKHSQHVSIRQVASLVGSCVANSQGCRWGKLYYRDLEREKIFALKRNKGNYDAFMSLSKLALNNINWWLTNDILEPVYFTAFKPTVLIESDASLRGWGGRYFTTRTGGLWSITEQSCHINWLELKACWLSLQALAGHYHDTQIAVKLDNTCAIYYLNNMGGIVSNLDKLAKEIWLWCMAKNISIQASYIPGSQNIVADFESRNTSIYTEWSLNIDCFTLLVERFKLPNIDLFASRLNHKLDRYVSWRPDPFSRWTDAFTLDWNTFPLCYAFPPFALVGKVVNKCIADSAELLLVAPHWPTQYWFPLLIDCMIDEPLVFPSKPDIISLPGNGSQQHPIWSRLNLMCFRISGKR